MTEVNWQMRELFMFPHEIGQPVSAENIKITPQFTAEEFEGRPKLTGIYHIAVDVNLTNDSQETVQLDDAILIDDLDIKETNGYFEYALPFNIDFPPEAENPVSLKVVNPTYEVTDGHLAMIWDVICTYEETGIGQSSSEAKLPAESNSSKLAKTEDVVESTPEAKEQTIAKQETETAKILDTEQPKAVQETTGVTSDGDEVLDFIAQLEDGISTTSFRLNDVFV